MRPRVVSASEALKNREMLRKGVGKVYKKAKEKTASLKNKIAEAFRQ